MKSKYFLIWILILIISCSKEHQSNTENAAEVTIMKLTSTAFSQNGSIPAKYTCDGDDLRPPLSISDVPADAKSLALIMVDPDAPVGTWDHWVVFNVPASTNQITEGTEPDGVGGKNSWGRTGYGGPCPP